MLLMGKYKNMVIIWKQPQKINDKKGCKHCTKNEVFQKGFLQ